MTPATDRIQAMDVLRGFALFGILVVNLPAMALPSDLAFAADPEAPWPETAAWAVMTGVFMSKSFALFSTLFGMGLILQMQRAESSGRDFSGLYTRRLAVLAGIGVAHGAFLFVGDILLVYAVAGFVLFLCRRCRVRTYLSWAVVLMIVGTALTLVGASWEPSTGSAEFSSPIPTWAPEQNITLGELEVSGDEHWAEFERKAYAVGPYFSTLVVNVIGYVAWLVISSTISFNWHVVAYFFLGAALMKSGFFSARERPLRCRMAAIGLGVGIPLVAWSVQDSWASQSEFGSGWWTVVAGETGSVLLAAGYLGAGTLLVESRRFPRATKALAAAGRMALTNYLLQSAIGNVLFRAYGLGLWGAFSRVDLAVVTAATFAGQVLFSLFWLRRFGTGPWEWLWRRVTYSGRPNDPSGDPPSPPKSLDQRP